MLVNPDALTACGRSVQSTSPSAVILPDSVTILEAGTGATLSAGDLLGRMGRADFVLLGELHDNPVHHQVRGSLIRAAAVRPAVVFEQFQASPSPIAPPAAGETREAWLDANGFDRNGWRWPLHQPVVELLERHPDKLFELFEVRRRIDPDGAALAAERASERERAQLREYLEEAKALVASGRSIFSPDVAELVPPGLHAEIIALIAQPA